MKESTMAAIAAEAFDLLGTGRQTSSLTARYPDLGLAAAYRVARKVRELTLRAHSQNITVAASAMADRNTLGQRS